MKLERKIEWLSISKRRRKTKFLDMSVDRRIAWPVSLEDEGQKETQITGLLV
jgi:hypothetical protein